MTSLRFYLALAITLAAATSLRADELVGPALPPAPIEPVAPLVDVLPTPYGELPIMGTEIPDPNLPLIEGYEPVEMPNWAASPYRRKGWRFGLMPSISDDDDEFWLRVTLGYEYPDGHGKRAEFWMFSDDDLPGPFSDFWTSTFYFDWYKRFFYNEAELLLGGGLALGHQSIELNGDEANRFYGGGGSVVAEGFLPFVDGKRSDFGVIARGRVAALLGGWDRDFSGDEFDDGIMLVEEFIWGLEYRQLFGKNDCRYWYLNVSREIHHFGGGDLPYTSDSFVEGTAMNVGIAW
jgi:hypothetical protein